MPPGTEMVQLSAEDTTGAETGEARARRVRSVPMPWHGAIRVFEDAFGLILLMVLGLFGLISITPFDGWTGVVIVALAGLTATMALATVRARRQLVRTVNVLAFVALGLGIAEAFGAARAFMGCAALIDFGILAVAALAILRAVITQPEVGFRTILGAVSVYVILGILFTFVYVAVDRIQGQPFFGTTNLETGDTIFFSMTTLTTTGYGNLVPAAQPGKMFATIEMFVGQIFLVTLISRLVSMWRPGKHFLQDGD